MGKHYVLADALSRPNHILGSEVDALAGVLQRSVKEVAGVDGLLATSQFTDVRYIVTFSTITMAPY